MSYQDPWSFHGYDRAIDSVFQNVHGVLFSFSTSEHCKAVKTCMTKFVIIDTHGCLSLCRLPVSLGAES